ncbi:sulfate adenylyltransferase subunit 1 [Prosthecobacter debontii]|uniref:sulfate adenylyltransferase n=1 Tax=Prosthecobacter debontii TaxID=48467 RepID=A0A1T4XBG0_9BACT|nr:GTP-binding protein [Prosthecobacter debontii]SKA86894.1 sulfate adenylyltransferase subunit 1 [Prosthecobacter debontii]
MDVLVNPTESSLLRFTTAGSVDDGKSTLIGRLLYDSKSIFEDQLLAVEESSKRRGDAHVNLALLTDGLRAEREQGITIDVAYRYFATPKRKFIIADTPGHIQYTRNMVTGASTADLAIILVDARLGVIEQTMRHTYLASLLRINQIVLAVNKMDLVDFDEDTYTKIVAEYMAFAKGLEYTPNIRPIPISALNGDNVVDHSSNTDWYEGPSLLEHLETVQVKAETAADKARLPVQWVIRPISDQEDTKLGNLHDYRGFAGRVASGTFKLGEEVLVYPSEMKTRITGIHTFEGPKEETIPQLSYSITVADEIDTSRGGMIVKVGEPTETNHEFDAMICWFADKKTLKPRGRFYLRHTTNEVRAVVTDVLFKVNISTLEKSQESQEFQLNDIGCIRVRTSAPIFYDPYAQNRITGSFVLVDEQTNNTVAAGMILKPVVDALDEDAEVSI